MDTFFGIPSHPLFVHIPAVLLPLAAIGVVIMVIKPAWHQRYRWAVLGIGAIGTLGAILSAGAGESLEERLRAAGETATWEEHAEAGDLARTVAIVFFVLLAAYVLVPWWMSRRQAAQTTASTSAQPSSASAVMPRWLSLGLAVLVVIGAAASVVTVIDAGHSGAKSVWVDE